MTDETAFISSKEYLHICLELHRDPSLTLEKIENLISDLQEQIFESEKAYLRELDNKQYQKTLIERKGAKENNSHFIELFGYLDEDIKTLISKHNEEIYKLKADLFYHKKMKRIYSEMYPAAQKDLMSPRTTSPRINKSTTTTTTPRLSATPPGVSPRISTSDRRNSGTYSEISHTDRTIPNLDTAITDKVPISPHLSPGNEYSKESSKEGSKEGSKESKDSSNNTTPTSPKITKLLKSNSFLKRSIELMIKGKTSS